ncbi:MAG: OmpA family protein [Bacteroidetes bacterium]|nr:MAG: OmpA family protein [Bacteroidota bacterium]
MRKIFSIISVFSSRCSAGLFLFFILSVQNLSAQQDLTLYNMEMIPQRMYQNPALKPFASVNIGLPAISSEYLNIVNSGFKYTQLIRRRADDSLYVDMDNLISKLGKKNYLMASVQPDILSFGFQVKKKNYISFNITEKVNFLFKYPKTFIEFLWKGNGEMLDQEIPLNFRVNFSHYREFGLGFARDWNDKLRLGAKLKYLHGFSNIWTKKADIDLTTESTGYAITTHANLQLMTSGLDTSADEFTMDTYLKNKRNKGLGLDLGGVYQFKDKISFSGSIVDFGFIRWNTYVNNLESRNGKGEFIFQGLPVDQLIGNDTLTFTDLLDNLADSAAEAMKVDTTHRNYTTWLPTKIYFSGNYKVTSKSNAGVLFYSQFYDHSLHPGLALSFNQRVGRWFSASVSYSMYNRSYTNIGLGMSLNAGPVQLYVASDNILAGMLVQLGDSSSAVYPKSAKNMHIHFGLNLTFGRPLGDKDKDGIPDKKDDCPNVFGVAEFKGCPDKDGDHVPDKADDCPDIAGLPAFAGCPDRDGDKIIDKKDTCPDVAGLPEFAGCPDRDGDKITDKLDSCPDEAGLAQYFGCPDTDHDMVIDKRDACPNDSGNVNMKGCPDIDDDGIVNKDDRCPDKPGPKENDGCPLTKLHLLDKQGNIIASAIVDKDGKFTFTELPTDESALLKLESFDVLIANEVTVVTGKLVRIARRGADSFFHFENLPTGKDKMGAMNIADVQIKLKKEEAEKVKKAMETLEFDFGSDVIRSSSTDGLDLVAELLQQNHLWRLKLSGHTDNVSTLKFNMNLSKKRVESIKKYLIKKGVPTDQVVLKWYGPTKPIAPNDTEEGRQKNRRVEFLIIQ